MIIQRIKNEDRKYELIQPKVKRDKTFGELINYIKYIYEFLWKNPYYVSEILSYADICDVKNCLAHFFTVNFYENNLSNNNKEGQLLFVISLLLKKELNQLNINNSNIEINNIDKSFLNNTPCSYIFEELFYKKEIQSFFKPIIINLIEELESSYQSQEIVFNPDLISTDIKNISEITVSTYQGLHSLYKNIEEREKFIKQLKDLKINTLVLDEAHHLRKEWWRALTYLNEELMPEQTLSLTATPPYDADIQEWARYEELCGPIDEVISIPELVKNKDLCPHQDFIHFSLLKSSENEIIRKHSSNVGEFLGKIFSDKELLEYIKNMSFLNPTENDIEKIYDSPDFYVSIVSFLTSAGIEIQKTFLKLFDAKKSDIPSFDIKQVKIFLNGLLITHVSEFKGIEEKLENYLNLAKRLGVIQNKKIVLNENSKIQKQIANSMGKLDSILEITELENNNLKDALRMVILADYIKAEDTDNSHLGVIPIWRAIKNKFNNIPSAILSGSVILIPKRLQDKLIEQLEQNFPKKYLGYLIYFLIQK